MLYHITFTLKKAKYIEYAINSRAMLVYMILNLDNMKVNLLEIKVSTMQDSKFLYRLY